MPPIAEGRTENQNEPKRPPLCGRLGSFWFSTRFTRKTLDYSNGTYLYPTLTSITYRKKVGGLISPTFMVVSEKNRTPWREADPVGGSGPPPTVSYLVLNLTFFFEAEELFFNIEKSFTCRKTWLFRKL